MKGDRLLNISLFFVLIVLFKLNSYSSSFVLIDEKDTEKFFYYSYAVFLNEEGFGKQAEELLRRYGNDPEILILLSRLSINDPYKALEYIGKAEKLLKKETEETALIKGQAYYMLYLKEKDRENLLKAEDTLLKYKQTYKNSLKFNYLMGEVERALGKYEEAIFFFEKAESLSNSPFSIKRILLYLYGETGNLKKLSVALKELLFNDFLSEQDFDLIVNFVIDDIKRFDKDSRKILSECAVYAIKRWEKDRKVFRVSVKLLFYNGEFKAISSIYKKEKEWIIENFNDDEFLLSIVGISLNETKKLEEFSKFYLSLNSPPDYLKMIFAERALRFGYCREALNLFESISKEKLKKYKKYYFFYITSKINYLIKVKNKEKLKTFLLKLREKEDKNLSFIIFKAYLFLNDWDSIEKIAKDSDSRAVKFLYDLFKGNFSDAKKLITKKNASFFLDTAIKLIDFNILDFDKLFSFIEGVKDRVDPSVYYFFKAKLLLKKGDIDNSILLLKRAYDISEDPYYANSYVYVSLQYNKIKSLKEKTTFKLLSGLNPSYLDTYGYYLLKKKKCREAIRYFFKAFYMMPFSGEVLSHIASSYACLEDYRTGSYYFEKAKQTEFVNLKDKSIFLDEYRIFSKEFKKYKEFFYNGVLLYSIKVVSPERSSFRVSFRFFKGHLRKISIYSFPMRKIGEIFIENDELSYIINRKRSIYYSGDFSEIIQSVLGVKIKFKIIENLLKSKVYEETSDIDIIIRKYKKGFPSFSILKIKNERGVFVSRINLLKWKSLSSPFINPEIFKSYRKVFSLEEFFNEK